MARNNGLIVDKNTQTTTPEKTRKQRTPVHSFRIVEDKSLSSYRDFVALVDNKVVANFTYYGSMNNLSFIQDTKGSYEGFTRYIRRNKDDFKTLVVTKSEDYAIVAALGDVSSIEAFLKNYCQVTLKEFGAVDNTDTTLETIGEYRN